MLCYSHLTLWWQVLAYSAGLGELLSDPSRLDTHLAHVERENCIHNNVSAPGEPLVSGCPNGLVIMTNRKPIGVSDLQVWEMATYNHAVLKIRRAQSVSEASSALAAAQGVGTSYSQRVNDQWNTAGIKFNDGNPSITSHYGYHMTSWHLIFALSGQQPDFSDPANATLTFRPAITDRTGCAFSYPVLLPGAVGTISCTQRYYTLVFTVAPKAPWRTVSSLAVGNAVYPLLPVDLIAAAPLVWPMSGLPARHRSR